MLLWFQELLEQIHLISHQGKTLLLKVISSHPFSLEEKQYVAAIWLMQCLIQNYIESPGHSPYHLPIAISKSSVAWFSQTCKWGYFQHAGMLSETRLAFLYFLCWSKSKKCCSVFLVTRAMQFYWPIDFSKVSHILPDS